MTNGPAAPIRPRRNQSLTSETEKRRAVCLAAGQDLSQEPAFRSRFVDWSEDSSEWRFHNRHPAADRRCWCDLPFDHCFCAAGTPYLPALQSALTVSLALSVRSPLLWRNSSQDSGTAISNRTAGPVELRLRERQRHGQAGRISPGPTGWNLLRPVHYLWPLWPPSASAQPAILRPSEELFESEQRKQRPG